MGDNRAMTTYRLAEAAEVLGVSDDTVRRWVEAGRLPAVPGEGRVPTTIRGADLAALAESLLDEPDRERSRASSVSARNRLGGIVTRVKRDAVMAQVEMVCGSHRMVSLMSADAADELGLEPGVRAVASVKSTNVVVEVP
jgi:molybdopterin-binding protein